MTRNTTTIEHHLTPALLMAYSAGALPEAFSLVAATHISMCDHCRAELETYDTVGGAILDTVESDTETPDFAKTMARIARADAARNAPPTRLADDVLPAPLASYVGGSLDNVKWRKVGGGVKQAILSTDRDASARLLYIPAGTAVPDHGHRGIELTLVLQGAFRDEDGRFARGDLEVADESVDHTPVADEGEDCICLAATDAPLRFSGMLPRLAQPFFQI
ncbi:ChrR family anti-sigma-E factor [Pseudaestuariivita atlantica]|uniref:Transcriptional regulator n=1 Tax=Pseudaestuariivita atlantica TaxID=1317121 RepID=A0A0L1JSJ4_9RHOB|nr:ChrR family anti-sigma-E factor [Pseudaestuariivita atlantica]KNG94730.1 transcriptional regulator [Pseudaestuariivita atlantica]